MAKQPPLEQPPVIRDGNEADTEAMVATLSDSFSNDPMMNWVIPPAAIYPDYFRLLIREVYLPRGMIHVDQDRRAVALWLPPKERLQMAPRSALLKLTMQLLQHGGLRAMYRIRQQSLIFSRQLPREPHYYLQFIGCRREDQGRGLGSALLEQGTRICDEQNMPAYLESSNRLNLPLYERHGFEVVDEKTLGRKGPTAWFMWREAR